MFRDVRYGLRMLLKQPAFSVIAVLTLALGIGATSAVFSLVQGVLLTPPPYQQPDRLMLIPPARPDGQDVAHVRGWAAAQWMEWQKQAKSFESIAAYSWTFNFLILTDGSESMEGMWVTRDYFRVTGLQPMMGRTFLESETGPTPAPVVILGYDLWQRKFNGDPHILGKTIRISRWDTPPKVIGVMPPGVRFLPSPAAAQEPNYNVNALVDFWIPAPSKPTELKAAFWNVVGRLQNGSTLKEAQAELTLIAKRQAQADHDFEGIIPEVQSLPNEMNRDGGRILLPLLGAAALVLLIACGNAAALLLVRGLQRQQEYAVRSALGIGRAGLFRQVSTESLLLALLGGALGVGLAFGAVHVLKLIGGHAIPRLDAVTAGWPVLASALGAAVLAAVLAGIFPAFRASRLDPMNVLKSAGPKSSAGRGERRLLRGVTMVQTALTLALLVGAGLLVRTMMNLAKVQSGYDTAHILTMSVTAVQGKWADFHLRALERVAALPGVQHAAFAWGVPLTGNNWPAQVEIEGQPAATKASDQISLPLRAVTPGYFQLLGLAIADGRDFRASDTRDAAKVAVINRALADRYFPHANPIGKKLWFDGRQQPPIEIIGVATNGRTDDLTRAASPEVYLPLWQANAFSKHLVIRAAADPRSLITAVQRELRLVDPTVAIENMKTLEQIRGDSVASRTFAMQLLAGFSVVGSMLTLVGIYGVLSLSVASRRREIAIRTAVGAQQRDIRNLVFGEGFRLIAGGVIAGVTVSIILSRVLRSFLFEVEPTDPATLVGVVLLFACVAMLACWVPTRRAAKV
ncbi:MAG: ABC transporter permease, partial [Bryobacteraceae bacterium]